MYKIYNFVAITFKEFLFPKNSILFFLIAAILVFKPWLKYLYLHLKKTKTKQNIMNKKCANE